MYYLLTGYPPFDYEKPVQVMIAHATESPLRPSDRNDSIPSQLDEIVIRCLEKNPAHRYQSALDLQIALEGVILADVWDRDTAAQWWEQNGCPQRKALAAAALEAAAI